MLSPLFIGSGERLTPMEYILDGSAVHVPSIPDMVEAFAGDWRRGLMDDFQRFITSPDPKQQLGDFTRKWNFQMNPPPDWVRYTVRAQPGFQKINALLTFVRDPEGMAYIPGSSVKGALRTALIARRMTDRDADALRRELETYPGCRRASAVEQVLRVLAFNLDREKRVKNDAVNDLLRAVEISDSAPFPAEALTACRRHWLSARGDDQGGRSPVFMECLRPGFETAFYVTVDHSLWPGGEDALGCLRDALTEWNDLCRRAHEAYFEAHLAPTAPVRGAPIVLGGGTGFQRKSLVYRTGAYPEEAARLAHQTLKSQFPNTYKPRDAETAPYMFKAAAYQGRLYPMGACDLRL